MLMTQDHTLNNKALEYLSQKATSLLLSLLIFNLKVNYFLFQLYENGNKHLFLIIKENNDGKQGYKESFQSSI